MKHLQYLHIHSLIQRLKTSLGVKRRLTKWDEENNTVFLKSH